ncbi:MAG: DRTGG domain-containing protein [Oscillospiraceae bacterium]|nr:DRTGG domain-containing protein [Oscillospiraceae bacterium]
MKLDRVMEILDAKVYTDVAFDEIEINAACGADLMSDALAFGENKGLLLTGLNNPQCIRTAEMMDIHCVMLVRGKEPDEALVNLANEKSIVVMKTDYSMYSACGRLFEAGLPGGDV